MISRSAALSTSVTKSLRPLDATAIESRRFRLRTMISPARRAARTAMLRSGGMIDAHDSNAHGVLAAGHRTPTVAPPRFRPGRGVPRAAVRVPSQSAKIPARREPADGTLQHSYRSGGAFAPGQRRRRGACDEEHGAYR